MARKRQQVPRSETDKTHQPEANCDGALVPSKGRPRDRRSRKSAVLPRELEGKAIHVPDLLWNRDDLGEGAKLLWCFLWAVRHFPPTKNARQGPAQEFTFDQIRNATNICQNSLLDHLHELANHGWLRWEKASLRSIVCEPLRQAGGPSMKIPVDLLFDHTLPRPAKWLWGVILRISGDVDYQLLRERTGSCHVSLCRHLEQLFQKGWLTGSQRRLRQGAQLSLVAVNPYEIRRQADLKELSRQLDLARTRQGSSVGQCLLTQMVKILLVKGSILVNAEVAGLENIQTGGQMHYDLYLSEHNVAIEFQGRQHDGPTERFPDPEAFRAQYTRDVVKCGLSVKSGVTLVPVKPEDLSFERLRELLGPHLPLREDLTGLWHLYDRLEHLAKRYRSRVPNQPD